MNSGEVGTHWGRRKSVPAQISAHIHPCGSPIRPAQNCARWLQPIQAGIMSMQICIHITLRYFQSNKCKITEGKISRSTFHPPSGGKEHTKTGTMSTMPGRLSTTSGDTPSVAALQCYSSKTSNAKLKKKFILYIFIYIYINIYNMASFLECV